MAKSSTYFGLRRGSTKSHTFSVVDGKQITKDRVEGGKDPRTFAQMSQRCLVSTIGSAYSATKCICDHSFEGKSAGMPCMREFMSTNLKLIQISKEYDNGSFGFNRYKESAFKAGSYVISKGCKIFGDMCTVAVMYPKSDGSYGFGAVRFTYISGATILESFAVAVIGDVASATPTFTSNLLKVDVHLAYNLDEAASTDSTYMTAITSRKVNGSWLRSYAQFNVSDAIPTFAAAISTYPIGQERFLNGSDISTASASTNGGDNSGSNGEDDNSGKPNQTGNEEP